MVAGMPAAYKSMFTLALCNAMDLPTLYVSADSDPATQLSRLAAMRTGFMSRDLRENITAQPVVDALSTSKIRFSFESNPDMWDIASELDAYVEIFDEYPAVIIVDNLRNVYNGSDSEHRGYKETQQALIEIARRTHACVITMHHMTESVGEPSIPSARKNIDGKVAQLPDFILSVARDGAEFRVSVVKDREGEDYPEATKVHAVQVDTARGIFSYKPGLQARVNMVEEARIAQEEMEEWQQPQFT